MFNIVDRILHRASWLYIGKSGILRAFAPAISPDYDAGKNRSSLCLQCTWICIDLVHPTTVGNVPNDAYTTSTMGWGYYVYAVVYIASVNCLKGMNAYPTLA